MKFGTSAIYGIAYGGPSGKEKFVAVGNDGKGAYSADGVTWTARTLPEIQDVRAVTYGGGKFVAVGDATESWHSINGMHWTRIDVEIGSGNIYGVAYGGGRYVATGADGKGWYASLSNITASLVFKEDGTVGWARG
jgi:hypothetical protein